MTNTYKNKKKKWKRISVYINKKYKYVLEIVWSCLVATEAIFLALLDNIDQQLLHGMLNSESGNDDNILFL